MSFAVTVTVTDTASGGAVPDCRLQVCSDEAGTVLLFEEYTTTAGSYAFSLEAGTYYVFARKAGYRFDNPTLATVTAALAVSVDAEPLNVYDAGTTEICNAALDLLGAGVDDIDRLDSYENDTDQTADWFRDNYEACKKEAILRHDWDECIDYQLGTDAGGDVSGINHEPYEYAYLIPSEMNSVGVAALRGIVDAEDHDATLKYRLAHGYIHTDYETDQFAWKLLLNIETGFSSGLRRCIEYELAIKAASKFLKGKGGDEKRRMLLEEYRELILPDARGQNQTQQYDTYNETRDESWVDIT